MSHSTRLGPDSISRTLARDRLGAPSVIFFVMSAATPFTVIAGVVTTGYAVTGITGFPIAFAAIALVLALFSIGYVAMSRHITNAGAFYTYVTHGLGRPAGVGAAWVALLTYNALQIGLYGIIGAAAAPKLEQWFSITPDWWVVALVAWAIVALLGVLRVDVNSRVLAVLLLAEIAIILIYNVADLGDPAGGEISYEPLAIGNLFESGVGAILVLAVLGFIGFESSVVFSEESRNPRRTIALATFTSIAIIGLLYLMSAWAMAVAAGPDNIQALAGEAGPGTLFVLAEGNLGSTWVDIGEVLFVTSVLAAMISFHNTCARYSFALGRERVLPAVFGRTSPRSGSPVIGSVIQSVVALIVIVIYAVQDLDPVLELFFYGGSSGALGVLFLLALTSFAIIAFFAAQPAAESAWSRLIAPVLATIALVVVAYLAVDNFDIVLGPGAEESLYWAIPVAFAVAWVLGFLWALILRSTRRDVYAAIGLGANAATGLAMLDEAGPVAVSGQPSASSDEPVR